MNPQDPRLKAEFSVLLDLALKEDLADQGDPSASVFPRDAMAHARIFSRQEGVLSGLGFAAEVFKAMDPGQSVLTGLLAADGDVIHPDEPVLDIRGPAGLLVTAERTALNFLGLLSGIAGKTREHVRALGESSTKLLDTRKTIPGFRLLSKAAVLDGGGNNHRFGLYDMIMLKDNHVDAAGGIIPALERARSLHGSRFAIEVECRNLEQVRQALEGRADVIMLDNMSYAECAAAVQLRREEFPGSGSKFEASGDFTPEKIRRFADLNLEYISVGGLTHSVINHNFSMRIVGDEAAG